MKLINDMEQGDEYLVDRARADIAEMRGVSGVVNLPLGALAAKAGKTFCIASWVKAKEGA